jgi:hypothetical protein
MNLVLEAIPVPLRDDGHGGLRVGQTRVSLESVWHLHQQGASPAEIVQAFDTLQPADVHAVSGAAPVLWYDEIWNGEKFEWRGSYANPSSRRAPEE